MRITAVLRQQALKQKGYNSLALSVWFKHPDFDMKDYEILSRASAFLLGVDPPEDMGEGPYGHLEATEARRKIKSFKRQHGYTPASAGGQLMDMGWLEFAPREYRPNVHIVASSHVFAPFLWKDYYPHDWLKHVKKEHCRYSLEVYDAPGNAVAEFPLDAEPFHHPEGRDVALAHFRNEQETLPQLRNLGVEVLHLREDDRIYEKGETVFFDGYAVTDDKYAKAEVVAKPEPESEEKEEADLRVFYPHKDAGTLQYHTKDRFFASTPSPLPEGLCGAPVLDEKNRCCGIVEGIVPVDHQDSNLAGSAAFMPHFVMSSFIEYVERQILRVLMDDDMFQMVVTAKKTNTIGGGVYKMKDDGSYGADVSWQDAHDSMVNQLKKQCSKEEFEAMMAVMDEEKKEIQRIYESEGGDLEEIASRVRARTVAMRDMVHEQYRRAQQASSASEPQK